MFVYIYIYLSIYLSIYLCVCLYRGLSLCPRRHAVRAPAGRTGARGQQSAPRRPARHTRAPSLSHTHSLSLRLPLSRWLGKCLKISGAIIDVTPSVLELGTLAFEGSSTRLEGSSTRLGLSLARPRPSHRPLHLQHSALHIYIYE